MKAEIFYFQNLYKKNFQAFAKENLEKKFEFQIFKKTWFFRFSHFPHFFTTRFIAENFSAIKRVVKMFHFDPRKQWGHLHPYKPFLCREVCRYARPREVLAANYREQSTVFFFKMKNSLKISIKIHKMVWDTFYGSQRSFLCILWPKFEFFGN